MLKEKKIGSFILKTLIVIVAIIMALIICAYFMFKNVLNINIFTISSTLNKLQEIPSKIIQDPYDDEYTANTFASTFDSNEIYSKSDESYTFSLTNLNNSKLISNPTLLTQKQLSSMLNIFINRDIDDWFFGQNDAKFLELQFKNIFENKTELLLVYELSFENIKNSITNGNLINSFINKYIPDKIYFFTLLSVENNLTNPQITIQKTFLNNLSENDSIEVLNLLSKFFAKDDANSFIKQVIQSFINLTFNEESGFFSSFQNIVELQFINQNNNLCLKVSIL